MSWQVVAKKEFSDAARSLVLWIISAVFVLFGVLLVGAYIVFDQEFVTQPDADPGTALDAMIFVLSPIALVVPIIGLVVGYKSIVGERESGSLKVLLSLPHSRWDVMFGKLVGRTLVVVIPLVVALIVMGGLITLFVDPVGILDYLVLFVLSILLAGVFVAFAVSISGSTSSSTIAGAAMFGVYLLFLMFWDLINLAFLFFIEGTMNPGADPPGWYLFFEMLSPDGAYIFAAQGLLPGVDVSIGMNVPEVWYLSGWVALLILVIWFIVPFTLGYYRFREADL